MVSPSGMILKCWDEGTRCLPFRKGAFGAAHVGKLVFVRMRERKTFPLGGRWHGEAVTDEGKRRDFLGDNDKRGKLPTWYSCFSRQNPSVRQPLIRPSVRYLSTFPPGEGIAVSHLNKFQFIQLLSKTDIHKVFMEHPDLSKGLLEKSPKTVASAGRHWLQKV